MRSHSLDVAENFKQKYSSNECINRCTDKKDSQAHLYRCQGLQNQNALSINNITSYEEIYESDVKKQLHIMRIIYSAYQKRCELMSSSENPEDPAGLQPLHRLGDRGAKTTQNS